MSKAGASRIANGQSESSNLKRYQNLRQEAHALVSHALDLEGQNAAASTTLKAYEQGRDLMMKALAFNFDNEADRKQGEALNKQMKGTLKQVEDRIRELRNPKVPEPRPKVSGSSVPSRLAGARSKTNSGAVAPSRVATASSQRRKPGTPGAESSGARDLMARLRNVNVDTAMANRILNEVLLDKPGIEWDDIAGLEAAKQALKEIVILPFLRPDLFVGLRRPAQGVLLYGPPGTGKTLLARAVATQCNALFFSISASSLTSKFVGESEKLVRTLFTIARHLQPAIIFIDEIDSILAARSDNEHESSRRLKTEFLVQFDGMGSSQDDRVLIIGATNRPTELDEAARRRFVKRIYIPLPDSATREQLLRHLLRSQNHNLSDSELRSIAALTDGFSGSDLTALAREAAMGPIRAAGERVLQLPAHKLRALSISDFKEALKVIRKSVAPATVKELEEFSRLYGTSGA